MKKIVLASGNPGKLREFAEMLASVDFDVVPQSQFNVPKPRSRTSPSSRTRWPRRATRRS